MTGEIPKLIPALTIIQPWPWCILEGHKPVENRSRFARDFRGPLLIHAGLKWDQDAVEFIADRFNLKVPAQKALHFGGIIEIVDVVAVVDRHASPWFFGPLGIVMERPRRLPFTSMRGQQSVFYVEVAAVPGLADHLREAA